MGCCAPNPGAGRLHPVRVSFPALHRPAHRARRRGEPGQLPLAAVYRGPGAAVPAGIRLRSAHVLAALLGFSGAAIAILGGRESTGQAWNASWGYLLALGSALIWANYSLQTKRAALTGRNFPTAAIGLFGLVSGLLSLLCHCALEPAANLNLRDALLLTLMGLGPLGAAFFLWDRALKLGDARQIGILSYITPLASTTLLMLVSGRPWNWSIAVAALMIVGAAVLGTRAK